MSSLLLSPALFIFWDTGVSSYVLASKPKQSGVDVLSVPIWRLNPFHYFYAPSPSTGDFPILISSLCIDEGNRKHQHCPVLHSHHIPARNINSALVSWNFSGLCFPLWFITCT